MTAPVTAARFGASVVSVAAVAHGDVKVEPHAKVRLHRLIDFGQHRREVSDEARIDRVDVQVDAASTLPRSSCSPVVPIRPSDIEIEDSYRVAGVVARLEDERFEVHAAETSAESRTTASRLVIEGLLRERSTTKLRRARSVTQLATATDAGVLEAHTSGSSSGLC